MRNMDRDELRTKMQVSPGSTLLLDVRDREDYEKEHIYGAVSVPVAELSKLVKKHFSRDQEIVVYCTSFECPASTRAAHILEKMGYKYVSDYKGGLLDWKVAGFLTEGREAAKMAA